MAALTASRFDCAARSSTVAMIWPMVRLCSDSRAMLAEIASICWRMRTMAAATSAVDLRPSTALCAARCALSATLLTFWLASCVVCRTSSTVVVVWLTAAADSLALAAS